MSKCHAMRTAAVCCLIVLSCGCAALRATTRAETDGAATAYELVTSVAPHLEGADVTWLGMRDGAGARSSGALAMGEHVLSALLRHGVTVASVDTAAADWSEDVIVPRFAWATASAPIGVGGRVHLGGAWAYVRLAAVDTRTGRVLAATAERLPRESLAELAERSAKRSVVPVLTKAIRLRMQLLATRVEGGISRQLDLEEGGSLLTGDRLQLRLTVSDDCEIYAFLIDSEGKRREVFGSELVYSDREVYAPGKGSWITLQNEDRVYTLYLIASRRLSGDRSDMWRQMEDLIDQGMVDRFSGLELQDELVAEHVMRSLPAEAQVRVQRGMENIELGQSEEVILADGTRLEARPQTVQGQDALIRAISFLVQ